jgi:hypothetical protein
MGRGRGAQSDDAIRQLAAAVDPDRRVGVGVAVVGDRAVRDDAAENPNDARGTGGSYELEA